MVIGWFVDIALHIALFVAKFLVFFVQVVGGHMSKHDLGPQFWIDNLLSLTTDHFNLRKPKIATKTGLYSTFDAGLISPSMSKVVLPTC